MVNGFTKIKNTQKREKHIDERHDSIHGHRNLTTPNAPRSLATEILTHQKFVKLQYDREY